MALLTGILALVAIVLAIAYIGREAKKEEKVVSVEELDSRDIDPEKSLLRLCEGDEDRFETLVQQEQELRPKITRKQAIKNALYRLRNLH